MEYPTLISFLWLSLMRRVLLGRRHRYPVIYLWTQVCISVYYVAVRTIVLSRHGSVRLLEGQARKRYVLLLLQWNLQWKLQLPRLALLRHPSQDRIDCILKFFETVTVNVFTFVPINSEKASLRIPSLIRL